MPEPIIIKGKLYLEESLNTVWIVNTEDKYTNILDFLRSMDHHQVTITVVSDKVGNVPKSVRAVPKAQNSKVNGNVNQRSNSGSYPCGFAPIS